MQSKTLRVDILVGDQVAPLHTRGEHQYVGLPHKAEYSFRFTNIGSTQGDARLSIDGKTVNTYRVLAGSPVTIRCSSNDNDRKFVFFREQSGEVNEISPGLIGKSQNGLVEIMWRPERQQQPVWCTAHTMPLGTTRCARKSHNLEMLQCSDAVPTSCNISSSTEARLERIRNAERESHPVSEAEEESYDGDFDESIFNANATSAPVKLTSGLTMFGGSSGQRFREVPDITDVDQSNACTITFRLVHDPNFSSLKNRYMPLQDVHEKVVPPRVDA